jgi:hypothetical protein
VTTWKGLFEDVAAFFGVKILDDKFRNAPPRPVHISVANDESENGMASSNSNILLRNSLAQWARESQTIDAWNAIPGREGLDHDIFHVASWAFADGLISL